jgi:hypothetical protein
MQVDGVSWILIAEFALMAAAVLLGVGVLLWFGHHDMRAVRANQRRMRD